MKKAFLLTVGVALASVLPLSGCFSVTGLLLRSINVMEPSLNVGGSTEVYVDAATLPFRTIRCDAVAQRGRIERVNGETNRFKYYAPFTSQAPNTDGNMESGDTITIQVYDGFQSTQETRQINLTGSTIAMVSGGENSLSMPGSGQIVLASVDSGGTTVLGQKNLTDRFGNKITGASPVISPDGRRIAYVSYAGTGGSQIRTIDAARETMTVTNNTSGFCLDPTWSPSSQEVAYVWDKNGNYDLFRVDIRQQGNAPVQITSTKVDERHPAWNAHPSKSNLIAVCARSVSKANVSTSNSNVWNLFVVDLNKNGAYDYQLTQLSNDGDFALEPSWKSDGEYISYTYHGPIQNTNTTSQSYQRIYVQRYTDSVGSGVPLNPYETEAGVRESSPMWNADGNSEIAYLATVVTSGTGQGTYGNLYKQVYSTSTTTERPSQWSGITGVPTLWMNSMYYSPQGCRPSAWR